MRRLRAPHFVETLAIERSFADGYIVRALWTASHALQILLHRA